MMNEQTLPENEQPIASEEASNQAPSEEMFSHDNEPQDTFEDLPPLPPSFDIDAALAAIGSLSDVVAEREAEEAAERARLDAIRQAEEERLEIKRREDEEYARWVASYDFARPPLNKLQRGQPASVIPALLLMASGAYLTFALTLSDTPPAPEIVLLIVCGVVGFTLLSHWFSSARWARGALFAGLSLMLGGASVFYLTLPGGLDAGNGWGLVVIALGLSALLSVILSRPMVGRLVPVALALILSGGLILAFSTGLLNPDLLTIVNRFWYIALIVVAVLMLIPVVFRKRR